MENIIHHASGSPKPDPQKDLHTDTFHPCVKAWLYIDEVSDQNGPFTFIPGSLRLTWKRVKWEYRQSLLASQSRNDRPKQRYWDGSFRVSTQDAAELGYGLPLAMKVAANTLLIANTHGIHCRGEAKSGATRMTIWMQARDNPFNPVFSPAPQLTARIFEFVWKKYLKKRTAAQVQRGAWRVASGGFSVQNRGEASVASTTPPHASPTDLQSQAAKSWRPNTPALDKAP